MEEVVQPTIFSHSPSKDLYSLCPICGENHTCSECGLIEIKTQVLDTVIPSRARLTLPTCMYIETMADQSFGIVANAFIERGTKFGPLEAQKTYTLDFGIEFPLKIINSKEIDGPEYYLNTRDENNCNWLMFVSPAQSVQEQNLICYQEHSQIFYVTIKDIEKGEHLKVWYAPYYAMRMKSNVLTSLENLFETNASRPKNISEPMVLDDLIKGQQKILARENWTCKFCGHVENYVSQFAKHIKQHYADKQYDKTHCDICNKSFDSPRIYRRHCKVIHEKVARTRMKSKKTKSKDPELNNKDILIGGPLLNNLLNDSMDNTSLLLPNVDLAQLSPALPNNLSNENILLDMSLNVDNLFNDNVKELDFNIEANDSPEQYVCDICLHSFSELHRFLQHLNKHTGKFTCQNCLKVFCRKENLNAHNCNAPNFACELCQKQFKLRKHLKRHFESAHNKKFSCKICNKYYYSQTDLNQHNCVTLPDSSKLKFTCTICNKTFLIKKYLQRHLKTHNNNNGNSKNEEKQRTKLSQYVCEVCAKVFTSMYGLNHHRKVHSERSLSCKVCLKKFYRIDVLRIHMATMHKSDTTKEQQCSHCNLTFKNIRLLSIHRQKQHYLTSKIQKCDICNKSFREHYLLMKHRLTFHTKTCPHCSQQFDTVTLLKAHMFEHTGKGFECHICHTKMKLRSSLTRHIKKLHPEHITAKNALQTVMVTQNKEDNTDETASLISFVRNNDNNEVNADFENYSSCQSILDNFEEMLNGCNSNDAMNLLNNGSANLDKENVNDQHFEFEDFGIGLQNSGKFQNVRNDQICLSMPDITGTEQEVTLGDNAYILEDGTIVEPSDDGDLVVYLTKEH